MKAMGVMKRSVFFVACVLLVGCGTLSSNAPVPTQVLVPSTDTPVPTATVPGSTPAPAPPGPSDISAEATEPGSAPMQSQVLVGAVIADLADYLGVEAVEIDVVTVEQVVWNGYSVDCDPVRSDDERQCADLSGFRVVLSAEGESYEYRTDTASGFVMCDCDTSDVPGEPVLLDTYLRSLVDVARRHLAGRLDLPLRRVFVVAASPMVWTDGSLGCGSGEQDTDPTPVHGYQIILRIGRETYEYHSDLRQVIWCPEGSEQLAIASATPEGIVTPVE